MKTEIQNDATIQALLKGPKGESGADSTVVGPKGDTGADSTVAGPKGDAGDDSTVAGPPGAPGTSQLAGSCKCGQLMGNQLTNCVGVGAGSASSGSTCRCAAGTTMQGIGHFKVCIAN
jgi:hypothetical protein